MVGEPTTYTRDWFDGFGESVEDATPLLVEARAVKTAQEIERMRLANAIAAAAMEHCQARDRAGHERGADRSRVAGLRARRGNRMGGEGRPRARLLPRLGGPRHQDLHRDHERARPRGRADALRDLGLRGRLLVRSHEEPRGRRAHLCVPGARGRSARGLCRRACLRSSGREPRRARSPHPSRDRESWGTRVSPRMGSATVSARARTSLHGRTRQVAGRSSRGWFLQSSQGAIWTEAVAFASRTTS